MKCTIAFRSADIRQVDMNKVCGYRQIIKIICINEFNEFPEATKNNQWHVELPHFHWISKQIFVCLKDFQKKHLLYCSYFEALYLLKKILIAQTSYQIFFKKCQFMVTGRRQYGSRNLRL